MPCRKAIPRLRAADVQRYLSNEPVLARPPSRLYRFQKFARRNKFALAAVASITLALVAGITTSTLLYLREKAASQRAVEADKAQRRLLIENEAAFRRVEQNLYAADMKQAMSDLDSDDLGNALGLLNKHRPKVGEAGASFEWRWLWQQCQGDPHEFLPPVRGVVWWLAHSPDRNYLAAAADSEVAVFDLSSRTAVAHVDVNISSEREARCAVFTPDGKTLIISSHNRVKFFETRNWTERPARLPPTGGPIALSPDGNSLVTMPFSEHHLQGKSFKSATIWNLRTLQVSLTLTNVDGPPAFSPDGKHLAMDTAEGIKLWPLNPSTGAPILLEGSSNLFGHVSGYSSLRRSMAFSPDGRWIAAGGNQEKNHILLWDPATGRRMDDDQFEGHRNAFTCVAGVEEKIGRVRQLRQEYQSRGVMFWLIASAPSLSRALLAGQVATAGIDGKTLPVLHDTEGFVARRYGMTAIPAVVCIQPDDGAIFYRGAISTPTPSGDYLASVIERAVNGSPATPHETAVEDGTLLPQPLSHVVDYASEIAPLLQAKCVICHSPGNIAPWAMTSHAIVQTYASPIRTRVMTRFHASVGRRSRIRTFCRRSLAQPRREGEAAHLDRRRRAARPGLGSVIESPTRTHEVAGGAWRAGRSADHSEANDQGHGDRTVPLRFHTVADHNQRLAPRRRRAAGQPQSRASRWLRTTGRTPSTPRGSYRWDWRKEGPVSFT